MRKTALLLVTLAAAVAAQAQSGFALKNGDRVVFYGDSITDNAWYPKFVELFIRLRYPDLDVRFYNAGVGGDRVTGGWMGPIDDRMTRDLFSRKPTVVTVMLGMNDGGYQAPKDEITNAYHAGYQHMIDRLKKETPRARVFLIKPSPFDDVTRAPGWPGGYNGVMKSFGDYVDGLAKTNGYASVDFNAPVVSMLEKANASDAGTAQKIIPDRVHPGSAGHMVMAEQLLLGWGALPVVANVNIDVRTTRVFGLHSKVADVALAGKISWTQIDDGLPFPLDRKDPQVALTLKSGDFDQKLNQEMLTVKNLDPGTYTLNIDGKAVASFSADELGAGVNLAMYETPMLAQARNVWGAVTQRVDAMYNTWRQLEVGMAWVTSPKRDAAIKDMNDLSDELIGLARNGAKPVKHTFELVRQ